MEVLTIPSLRHASVLREFHRSLDSGGGAPSWAGNKSVPIPGRKGKALTNLNKFL
jgi:hypothetical protein